MSALDTLLLSLALGFDAFSVAVAVGAFGCRPRQVFRLSFHFGLFQFFMPLIGWQLEEGVSGIFGEYNHWIAFAILMVIGLKMIKEAFGDSGKRDFNIDRTRKWSLVLLSLATSIDALAAGFSIGLLADNLLAVCIVIGITASVMTIAGMFLGKFLRRKIAARRSEALGGLILIAIAFKMAII
jgi:putative Mn2+ efflux pump MntP